MMKQAWLVLHINENSGLAKQAAQRLEFSMSLFAGSILPGSVYDTRRAGEYQTVCAALSFEKTTQNLHKNHSLPHEIQ